MRSSILRNVLFISVVGIVSGCTDEQTAAALNSVNDSNNTNGTQSITVGASKKALDFGTADSSQAFSIVSNDLDLSYTVNGPGDWLQISPTNGTLNNGKSNINVTIDRERLENRQYSEKILVSTGIESFEINVNIDNRSYQAAERFSDKVKTVSDYKIEPGICELTGGNLNCRIKITNIKGSGALTIHSGRYVGPYTNTRLIKDGKEYGGYAVTFAGNTDGNQVTGFLLTNIPIEASIKFNGVPSDVKEMDAFEIKFTNGRSYSGDYFSALWQPVKITNRNTD